MSVRVRTRFEIIVNDWRLYLVEILEGRDCLNDDRPRLLLRQKLVLLQIEVEVVALAVTQHCTKPATHTNTNVVIISTAVDMIRTAYYIHGN